MQYGSFILLNGRKSSPHYGRNAVSSAIADLSDLSCTHEEADTRLLSHASHSFHHAFTKLIIHARDNVVVVLAIAVSIVSQHCETWVAFGHGSKLRFIPCHLIAAKLGNDGSWGLLLMHALSGYCFCVPWNWRENSLGGLVQYSSSRNRFLSVSSCSKPGVS